MDPSPTDLFWKLTKDKIKEQYKKYCLSKYKTKFPDVDANISGYIPQLKEVVGELEEKVEEYLDAKELIWHENKHLAEKGNIKFMDKQLDLIKKKVFKAVSKHGTSFVATLGKGSTMIEGPDLTAANWRYSSDLTKAIRYCSEELRKSPLSFRSFAITHLQNFFRLCFNVDFYISGPTTDSAHEDDFGNYYEEYEMIMGSGMLRVNGL